MKTIWKYPITLLPLQQVEMPEGSIILTFHKQGSRQDDEAYIWCLVDTEKPKVTRTFVLITTGDEIFCESDKCCYIGTLWLMNGTYVVHLIEILKG